jgi:hypothetical protein
VAVSVGSKGDQISLKKTDLVMFIDSSFVYPKANSVINNEIKEATVTLNYRCMDNKCSFTKVVENLKKSAELKGVGVTDLTTEVVNVLDDNVDVFPSPALGGYIFQSTGRSYLFLKNEQVSGPDCRYGFIELSDIRKKLIFEKMRQQEAKTSADKYIVGAALGVMSFQFLRFAAKHMK